MLYILGCLRTLKIWKFLFIILAPYFTSFLLYHNYRIKGNRVQGIFKVLGHGQHRAEPIIGSATAIITIEIEQTGIRAIPKRRHHEARTECSSLGNTSSRHAN